jgi:hypothetical protein
LRQRGLAERNMQQRRRPMLVHRRLAVLGRSLRELGRLPGGRVHRYGYAGRAQLRPLMPLW